jgi:hypothetical protein
MPAPMDNLADLRAEGWQAVASRSHPHMRYLFHDASGVSLW